jgi:hypothetical protein
MSLDQELISHVQQIATGETGHRARAMLACYVGFVGLLEHSPELRERALKIESALRTFCATGQLPPLPSKAPRDPNRRATG